MSCEHCTQGYVLPGEPEGSMIDGAYFHPGPMEGATTPSRAIVLLTDVFGLPLNNCRLIADEISKRVGCDVWAPDLFDGTPPFKVEEMAPLVPTKPGEAWSFWNRIRFVVLALSRAFRMYGVRASVVDPRVVAFVEKIKAEKKYEKIGAVGYCLGGSIAVRLGDGKHFDSIVVCHPGRITTQEIKNIKVPAAWVCAEEDMMFGETQRNEAEAIFAARKDTQAFVAYEFKDYKGTIHGFASRPNMTIPEVVEAYKGALDQTIEWFKKSL